MPGDRAGDIGAAEYPTSCPNTTVPRSGGVHRSGSIHNWVTLPRFSLHPGPARGTMTNVSNGSGRSRSRFPTLVLLLVALLTGGAVVYAAMRGGNDSTDAAADTATTSTTTEAPTSSAEESTTTAESTSSETSTSDTTSSEDTSSETSTSGTSSSRTTTATSTSAEPDSTDLASLQPADNQRPSTGEAEVGGRTYRQALSTEVGGCDTNGAFTYDLDGKYRTFTATVGTSDDSDSRSVVRFEVYADDELAYTSGNLEQGKTADIDIPVENVQTLRLGYLFIDGDLSQCSNGGDVVWADPTLTE